MVFTALSLPVSGQDPERWRDERRNPPVRLRAESSKPQRAPAPSAKADPELDAFGESMTAGLVRGFDEAVRSAAAVPADCRDTANVAEHQKALRALGRYAECTQWVATCERQGLAPAPVLSAAARCASADYQYARAHEWHERATRPENAASDVYPGMVYVFARFAYLTEYQDEVPGILARNPAWAGAKLPVVHGSIEYLQNGDTTLAPESAIRNEVLQWMTDPDQVLRQVALVDWGWDLLWNRGIERESARFFAERASELTSPPEWWPTALAALYYGVRAANPSANDFAAVRRLYEAALPYLHPSSSLPIQTNPYTYSELYAGVCRTRLTSGAGADAFRTIQRDWLAARVSASEARERALRLQAGEGERADVLTLLGGLAEDLGRDDEALDWYWRAHQACPYYNRAHDGLANVRLRRLARAFRDYQAILERADREVRAAPFTPDVRHFVDNWRSLSDATRKSALFGLRLWAPYVDLLVDQDARIYFKRAPELVSDIEKFAGYRDVRYSDNRLLDDISGLAGGEFAVIDQASALESPFFGGDITAHEVAHLFHGLLPDAKAGCITTLYDRAAARELFTDPYAATNPFEYFAVGAEVFLTPADAPPRFGRNVGWLRRNDPDLVRWLEQIAEGRPPAALSCPVAR
jgi:tetratricopeptide (TPR) repeat protein